MTVPLARATPLLLATTLANILIVPLNIIDVEIRKGMVIYVAQKKIAESVVISEVESPSREYDSMIV